MPAARRASVVRRTLESQSYPVDVPPSTAVLTSAQSLLAPIGVFIVSLSSMRVVRSRASLIITLGILLSLYGLSVLHNTGRIDSTSVYQARSNVRYYLPQWRGSSRHKSKHNHHHPSSLDDDPTNSNPRPPLQLTEPEELAALVYFISSIGANALPVDINPLLPLEPELVVDFDTRSEQAAAELQALVSDTWERYPIVIFSKLHSPISRNLQAIMDTYNLRPAPAVFEIDGRSDAEVITPLLYRLTSSTEFPILLVGGKSMGTIENIRALHDNGELKGLLGSSGAVVGGGKKRKGKRRAAAAAA